MGGCLSLRFKYVPSSSSTASGLDLAVTRGGGQGHGLTGNTFSHYSLTSATSCLDLYPAIRYMEGGSTESESGEDDEDEEEERRGHQEEPSSGEGVMTARRRRQMRAATRWRRSSVPLIDEWGEIVLRDEDNGGKK